MSPSNKNKEASRPRALAILLRVLKIFGKVFAVLIAILLILSIFRVSIPLSFLNAKIETAASQALGREFKIEGAPRIVIGLKPEFLIENCTISNPPEWKGKTGDKFASLDRCFVKLGLIPFLKKDIRIDKIEIIGLHVDLEETESGEINWDFDPQTTKAAKPKTKSKYKFQELRKLEISDIAVNFTNPKGEKRLQMGIEELKGVASSKDNLSLDLKGTLRDEPLSGTLRGGSLGDFVKDAEPWPYSFEGKLAGSSVKMSGSIATARAQAEVVHTFAVDAPELARLEPVTGPLPDLGAVHLGGEFTSNRRGFNISRLSGKVGEMTVDGKLDVNMDGSVPDIRGELLLGTLDTTLIKRSGKGGETPKKAPEPKVAEAAKPDPNAGKRVVPFKGELRLFIAEVVNPTVSVKELDLGLKVTRDSISGSISVDFAEAPMRGIVDIQRDTTNLETPMSVNVDLTAKNADIGALIRFYTGKPGFKGIFETLTYKEVAKGKSIADAWRTRQTILEVIDAGMEFTQDEKTVQFQLDRGYIDGAQTRESFMAAEGVFQGERFDIKFDQLKPERAPPGRDPFMKFTGTAAGATWRLEGKTPRSEDDPPLPLELEVSGASLGDMHNWAGVSADAKLPYEFKGTVLFKDGFLLNLEKGVLGKTSLSGELGSTTVDDKKSYLAKLSVDEVHIDELASIMPKSEKKEPVEQAATGEGGAEPAPPAAGQGIDLDATILPSKIEIDSADIDIKIGKIVSAEGEITDLTFAADMSEGWLKDAPFSAVFEGSKISGSLAADFRTENPEAGIELKAQSVDIGKLLGTLKVAKGMEATAGEVSLSLLARGSTGRNILLDSDLDVSLKDATWVFRDANTGGKMRFKIKTGSVGGKRGENTVVTLDGSLSGEPVKLRLETDGVDAFWRGDELVNLSVEASFADSKFSLNGTSKLPINRATLDAKFSISGKRFSDLDELLKADLPPFGPYTVSGGLRVVDEGYHLEGFDFKLKNTDLSGNVSILTGGTKPKIVADLRTKLIQTEDFRTGETWSARKGSTGDKRTVSQKAVALGDSVNEVLGAKLLGSMDVSVSIKADSVRSGPDHLGAGSAKVTVQNGRFNLSPCTLALPGGSFTLSLMFHPTARDFDSEIRILTEGFDYGVLARRIDPKSDMTGNLNVDIHTKNSRAPLDAFELDHASGHIRVEVCPEKLKAGIFDFWGTNILFAILPKLDPKNESKLNCIIAKFQLEKGVMTPEALGLDTTRLRVIADGVIDFPNNIVDLKLIPKAKRPEFLRAGLRIGVKGTLDEPKVDVGPAPILRSLGGMAGSTLLFPGKLFLQKRLPLDGSDICTSKKTP